MKASKDFKRAKIAVQYFLPSPDETYPKDIEMQRYIEFGENDPVLSSDEFIEFQEAFIRFNEYVENGKLPKHKTMTKEMYDELRKGEIILVKRNKNEKPKKSIS